MASFKLNKSGFTLIELMIGAAVLIIALVGLLATYTGSFNLNETARNLTIAMNVNQEKLEEIRDHDFDSIVTDYSSGGSPGDTFSPSLLDGSGIIEIIDDRSDPGELTSPDLIQVTITISWRQKGNRVIGEDANLDGTWDAGSEDANGNGQFDSPAQVITLIARR